MSVEHRRLHPLTPLLKGARLAIAAVVAISWRGFADLGPSGWALTVGGLAVLVLIGSAISWLVTGYEVVGRELRITEGLIVRRHRAIPLERLQAIEVVRPLQARLFGLAELRLEVVGASRTEAPLAYLDADTAAHLRALLLALGPGGARPGAVAPLPYPPAAYAPPPGYGAPAGYAPGGYGPPAGSSVPGYGAPAGYGPPPGSPYVSGAGYPAPVGYPAMAPPSAPAEHIVHTVGNGSLVLAQLLRPQWWLLPIGLALPLVYLAQSSDFGFVALASTGTAIIGTVIAPIRIVLAEWSFTIATAADGLRLRRGLTETRSQTVPAGRVQSVTVTWPVLWRLAGWVRATMHVAGVAQHREDQGGTGSLVPVGTVATVEHVIGYVLPGFALTRVAVHPPPARARLLAPLRAGVLGYQLTDTAFVGRSGLLARRLTIVAYGRIQSVRVRQGPLQRLLGLASVHVDTAGQDSAAAAIHRRVAEAVHVAQQLAERARHARRPASAQPYPVSPVAGQPYGAGPATAPLDPVTGRPYGVSPAMEPLDPVTGQPYGAGPAMAPLDPVTGQPYGVSPATAPLDPVTGQPYAASPAMAPLDPEVVPGQAGPSIASGPPAPAPVDGGPSGDGDHGRGAGTAAG